ncbi:hypothetical protein VroAM7_31580 [Vibrio rotiferianus]|uniref:Uncharacterized protein n=1 Tax=Vibrio rotiferianus TaxID=190895 RepID=A0A510I9U1_9VIBR|nr:DUF6404 family protein [Vibrio rotiferianus]BBL90505.1 hypothetical protein VroAM7_31580 [Vibrio rotiferianus]
MNYKEKLERADKQLKVSGLSCRTDKSFFYRFLRKRGFELKPVYYESFFKNVALKFTEFFIIFFPMTYLFSLAQDGVMFIDTLINALAVSAVFAIVLSAHYLNVVKISSLSDWNEL